MSFIGGRYSLTITRFWLTRVIFVKNVYYGQRISAPLNGKIPLKNFFCKGWVVFDDAMRGFCFALVYFTFWLKTFQFLNFLGKVWILKMLPIQKLWIISIFRSMKLLKNVLLKLWNGCGITKVFNFFGKNISIKFFNKFLKSVVRVFPNQDFFGGGGPSGIFMNLFKWKFFLLIWRL